MRELELRAAGVAPGDGAFHNAVSFFLHSPEYLNIDLEALRLKLSEDVANSLSSEHLRSALCVLEGESKESPDQQIKALACKPALERLLYRYLRGGQSS